MFWLIIALYQGPTYVDKVVVPFPTEKSCAAAAREVAADRLTAKAVCVSDAHHKGLKKDPKVNMD
jgi:hypothetical protein